MPMKATFFITYIMVDGWAGVAAEIIRLKPLIVFHLKNAFLVKTDQDREQAMDPGSIEFASSEPRIQLYFVLGLVYSVVTPILLPFILVFFGFGYLVLRHQVCWLMEKLQNYVACSIQLPRRFTKMFQYFFESYITSKEIGRSSFFDKCHK